MSFYQRMPILILSLLFFLLIPKIILGSEVKKPINVESIFNSEINAEIKKKDLTIVNFWATWCIPCIQEIPALVKIENEFKAQSAGVVFVNMDEEKKDVDKFLKKNKITINTFYENSTVADKLGFQTLPYSFIVKRDLTIVEVIRGGHDFAGFSKLLQKHIKTLK